MKPKKTPMGLLSGGRWKVSSFACRLLDFVSFASPLSFFFFPSSPERESVIIYELCKTHRSPLKKIKGGRREI